MTDLVGMPDNQWPPAEERDFVVRKSKGQKLGYHITKRAKKAMDRDPHLYWGIHEYVRINNLDTEDACRRHDSNGNMGRNVPHVDG